jgi:hypothetical protein
LAASVCLVVFVLTIAGVCTSARAAIWFVDEDAVGGDGQSWETAFCDLQDSLDVAVPGDQIWVAAGVYRPSALTDQNEPRSATFGLLNGVTIYGGLAGTEDPQTFDLSTRDFAANESILSGDLYDNDTDDFDPWHPTLLENCHHVVTGSGADPTAVIDGFTITAGHAKGDDTTDVHQRRGGGVYVYWGEPTLVNLTFRGNMGRCGGGLAGMNAGAGATLLKCRFEDNWSRSYGGGVCCCEGDITLVDCTFQANATDGYGGGLVVRGNSDPSLANCRFYGNAAVGEGGGVSTIYGHPTLTNCVLSGNTAPLGGALRTFQGQATLVNCTLSGNSAIYGNGVENNGGDIELHGCILRDGGDEIWHTGGARTVVQFSNLQGGYPGTGNIDADPLFVDVDGADNVLGTDDDDLHLGVNSPSINAGSIYAPGPPPQDAEGNPRVQQCRPDQGAFESPYGPVSPSDCNGNSVPDDCEVQAGTCEDCNQNHVPDDCEPQDDCNGNDILDFCELFSGSSSDCNDNAVPDECDIQGATSGDANGNDVPDECECPCGDIDRSGGPSNMADFAVFANCFGLNAATPECTKPELICSDLDGDTVVDLGDFATFAAFFGLSTTQVTPGCVSP